ncbi:MAG TPA: DUF1730 domain-containing protein [Spirochaetota bacterium]|nr:DUF1730 domain-containing protein [Spirochaetota bacterium]
MTEYVKKLAKDLKIDAVGFYNLSDEVNPDFSSRVYDFFPQAKSVISFALSYNFQDNLADSQSDGYIARYTTANYYKLLSTKLKFIAKSLKDKVAPSKSNDSFFRVFVNSKINDKEAGRLSGIGTIAPNSMIFVKDIGLRCVLGEIVVDYVFKTSEKILNSNYCLNCDLCVKNCPTGAILNDKTLVKDLCIQHLSSCRDIPKVIKEKRFFYYWGKRFFGCTDCVDICPFSERNIKIFDEEKVGFIGSNFDCEDILSMKKTDYKIKFRNNQLSASWIKEVVLARNALINLYNNDKKEVIEEYLKNIDSFEWSDDEKEYLKELFKKN